MALGPNFAFIHAGASAALFMGPVPEDKLPKDATAGRSLAGTLQLGLQQGSTKEHAPASVPVMYRYAFHKTPPQAFASVDSTCLTVLLCHYLYSREVHRSMPWP